MAKAKKKKVEIEENEFLRGLIDEVKNYEENSVVEISDDSLVSFEDVILPSTPESAESHARGIFESTKTEIGKSASRIPDDSEIPTVFRNLGDSLKEKHKPISLNDQKSSSADQDEPIVLNDEAPAEEIKFPQTSESSSSSSSNSSSQEKTIATEGTATIATQQEASRTIAVEGARGRGQAGRPALQEKVVAGSLKGTRNGQVYTSLDASLAQAETLKVAQDRIKELEYECDRLRQENDDLASASDVVTRRMEELQTRAMKLQKEKTELAEQAKSEHLILKGHLQYKDSELNKAKIKIEDLESRLKSDFRKIRVRERELENRLELVRAEKQALMRSKDEKILDLQRKLDQFKSELDLYRSKVQDLNKSMEEQQEQMKKTVRALRVALSNLEQDEMTKILSEAQVEKPSENLPSVASDDGTQAAGDMGNGYGSNSDEDPNKQNVG